MKNLIALSPLISVVISLIALGITWKGISQQSKNADRTDQYQRNTFILQNKINENNDIISLSTKFMEMTNENHSILINLIRKENELIRLENQRKTYDFEILPDKEKEKFSNLIQKNYDNNTNLYASLNENIFKTFGIIKQLETKQESIKYWKEMIKTIEKIRKQVNHGFNIIDTNKFYQNPDKLKDQINTENNKMQELISEYVVICTTMQSEMKIEEAKIAETSINHNFFRK
ncbi:exported protein of unknown function [Oenococcus oeni]|uniref:hypothetical protein n=1 Tax=Oenococcus oeni TaxID=1247 RepID=UPI00107D4BC6|nr:hypothetical protein [Oenococcus oeni]AVI94649.1 hypothetical protein AX764_07425 [Oenococcus oeni]SYV98972.1 exported hypothetical protein [Oenococcus oeni]SYV99338.1 exported hypothetical protein [Oenococcus oeni]SYW18164.1 exported hypothetical protein [Oenococcus oeni]VDC15245.1 exported protein of unknown function [Oenococcus oeni]